MESTKKLYDKDAYDKVFEAVVLSCEEIEKEKEKRYEVVLDQTLFFPEEGGQSPDRGNLNGIEVLDVQINQGVITHTLPKPLEIGETVEGKIDWQHRFFNMQQHSGEHIFSGLVHNRFGFDNVGFHLSDQIVTMDFNGVLSEKDVEEIEWAVNEAIVQNIAVQVTYPTKEELKTLTYRSKIEIEDQIRIVTIPGYDVCACCAPHVKRTGEIGMLKVMNVQNYKGGVRISILCGFRALVAMREKTKIVSSLVGIMTTNQDNLVENVSRLKTQNQEMSISLGQAKQALLEQKLSSIPDDQSDVILFEEGIDTKIVRNIVNGLMEKHDGICAMFVRTPENGFQYIIGSTQADCKEIANRLRTSLGAKGGGSTQMIQGSVVASKEAVMQVLLDRQ